MLLGKVHDIEAILPIFKWKCNFVVLFPFLGVGQLSCAK